VHFDIVYAQTGFFFLIFFVQIAIEVDHVSCMVAIGEVGSGSGSDSSQTGRISLIF
jgi:hypothetical protein